MESPCCWALRHDGATHHLEHCRHDSSRFLSIIWVVKDAHGNVLVDGACVTLIKDLPLEGRSPVPKGGTKSKAIRCRLREHISEPAQKAHGVSMTLTAVKPRPHFPAGFAEKSVVFGLINRVTEKIIAEAVTNSGMIAQSARWNR